MEKVLFKSEEKKQTTEVSAILRKIADKVESGEITLSQGSDKVHLSIPKTITLELKVEEETKSGKDTLKKSLEIELEWYEGEDGQPTAGDVNIG
ncbi:MAG: amphi-Trp domain-containing protein [Desulfonatronovibrio sp. MSAO_Bac4]|nr:MAG: amphi-Trp domain-containing protein [Desulfonatronovibrio sp. MSAO_Bac4]